MKPTIDHIPNSSLKEIPDTIIRISIAIIRPEKAPANMPRIFFMVEWFLTVPKQLVLFANDEVWHRLSGVPHRNEVTG